MLVEAKKVDVASSTVVAQVDIRGGREPAPLASTLKERAASINALLDGADKDDASGKSRRVKAGMELLAARQMFPPTRSGRKESEWLAWCKANIRRSLPDISKIMKIAQSDDPEAALRREREVTRAQAAKHKAARKAAYQAALSAASPVVKAEQAALAKDGGGSGLSHPDGGCQGAPTSKEGSITARVEAFFFTNPHATVTDLRAQVGDVGHGLIEVGRNRARARLEIEAARTASLTFTKAQLADVEAAITKRTRALEGAFQERVSEAARKLYDENFPKLQEEQNEAHRVEKFFRKMINDHKPVFTATEYMTILACLHPDNSASKEKRDSAFTAFSAMKFQLTGKK